MKFCPEHLIKLKQSIVEQGLGVYLAKSAEESRERMRRALRSTSYNRGNFEPVLIAQSMILNNALESIGPMRVEEMSEGDPEKVCPLCAMNQEFLEQFDEQDWLANAVLDVAGIARDIGLLTLQ